MQLSALQIVLLVLVAAEINVDRRGLSLTHARPVIVGFLCGLILGDMNSGLYIGGTFTLMSLGVAALGGYSVHRSGQTSYHRLHGIHRRSRLYLLQFP